MRNILAIFKREFASYFATPVAFVFLVIFLVLASGLAFSPFGGLYERQQADLAPFFTFHPWLYVLLMPALSMRLWAEERKSGSVELLFTLPITPAQAVIGKFLAAWSFAGVALILTFPIWITVNYLGDPDNGALLAGYIGSFFLAGGCLSWGACISALTRNQVISFVVSAVISLGLVVIGFMGASLHSFFPSTLADAFASLSLWTHFQAIQKGVIDLRDIIYFAALIGTCLAANAIIIDMKKAD